MKNVSPMIFVFTMFNFSDEKKEGSVLLHPLHVKSHAHRGNQLVS